MFKKSLIMLLCLSLVSCMFLTGCGKDEKESKKDKTESTEGVETSKPNYKVEYFDAKDGVYAEVNGETVSEDEVKYFLMMAMYNEMYSAGSEAGDDLWTDDKIENALDEALNQVVLMHVYKTGAIDADVELTDAAIKEIDDQLASMKEYYGEEMYNLQFEGMGISEEIYKNFSVLSLYANEWYKKYSESAVSDADITKSFRKDYVKAKHILIKKTTDEGEDISADAYSKIEDIKKQLDGGADFDTLMKENSEDPGLESAPNGYVFTKGQMVEEFETAAFNLEDGQTSDIVESSYGYHILKKVELTDADLEEMTSDATGNQVTVKEAIRSTLAGDKFNTLVEEVKADAKVKVSKKAEKNLKKNAVKIYDDFTAKAEEVSTKLQAMQQAQSEAATGDTSAADGE